MEINVNSSDPGRRDSDAAWYMSFWFIIMIILVVGLLVGAWFVLNPQAPSQTNVIVPAPVQTQQIQAPAPQTTVIMPNQPGQQGPAGATGPAGTQGPAGSPGPSGSPGQ